MDDTVLCNAVLDDTFVGSEDNIVRGIVVFNDGFVGC